MACSHTMSYYSYSDITGCLECCGFGLRLPSGNLLHSYGKSPWLMGKSTISMAIFHSYVKLPEAIPGFLAPLFRQKQGAVSPTGCLLPLGQQVEAPGIGTLVVPLEAWNQWLRRFRRKRCTSPPCVWKWLELDIYLYIYIIYIVLYIIYIYIYVLPIISNI